MIEPRILRAIQILAIKSVENPSGNDIYSKICRWYSREFSTPLHVVEDLDPIHVLSHFYQDRYQSMNSGDEKQLAQYEDEKMSILYPEEYEKKIKSDEEWIKQLEEEVRRDQERVQKQQDIESIAKKIGEEMADATSNAIVEAMEELNLIDDKFRIPDSGSMRED